MPGAVAFWLAEVLLDKLGVRLHNWAIVVAPRRAQHWPIAATLHQDDEVLSPHLPPGASCGAWAAVLVGGGCGWALASPVLHWGPPSGKGLVLGGDCVSARLFALVCLQ